MNFVAKLQKKSHISGFMYLDLQLIIFFSAKKWQSTVIYGQLPCLLGVKILYSNMMRAAPSITLSPTATLIAATLPFFSASRLFAIFIASRTIRV